MCRSIHFTRAGIAALAISILSGVSSVEAASEGCVLAAEISVELVCQGAMAGCVTTGNPVACKVAIGCEAVAAKELAKTGTAEGCTFVVEKVGPKVKIWVRSANSKLDEMKKTYDSLNTVKGIHWLEKQLQ